MRLPPPLPDRPPTVNIMRKLGLEPDDWQIEVLEEDHPRLLLNCCRQAGKSTAVAILGLVHAIWRPMTRIIILSRSHRQARELFRTMTFYYKLIGEPLKERVTSEELELTNLSRIVCLPCREDTIRGYAHVDFLIMDEAARVPDDLYRAIRPMLAVSDGRLICLSTPYGRRGFFWEAWARGGDDWARIEIPAARVTRIKPEFLAQEQRAMGESWFRQEYCCSFEALEGLVYPDMAKLLVAQNDWPTAIPQLRFAIGSTGNQKQGKMENGRSEMANGEGLRLVGGIDFGFRNPFAAVWGVCDRDGILWLTGEHYARQKALSYHAEHLPRNVLWYADPAGAGDIAELRCANFAIRKGNNALRPGIAAVTARIEIGTLRILEGRCPNLLAEAQLYRYPEGGGETPVDDHNHALAALRYLISKLDEKQMARQARQAPADSEPSSEPRQSPGRREPTLTELLEDESLWIPLG